MQTAHPVLIGTVGFSDFQMLFNMAFIPSLATGSLPPVAVFFPLGMHTGWGITGGKLLSSGFLNTWEDSEPGPDIVGNLLGKTKFSAATMK